MPRDRLRELMRRSASLSSNDSEDNNNDTGDYHHDTVITQTQTVADRVIIQTTTTTTNNNLLTIINSSTTATTPSSLHLTSRSLKTGTQQGLSEHQEIDMFSLSKYYAESITNEADSSRGGRGPDTQSLDEEQYHADSDSYGSDSPMSSHYPRSPLHSYVVPLRPDSPDSPNLGSSLRVPVRDTSTIAPAPTPRRVSNTFTRPLSVSSSFEFRKVFRPRPLSFTSSTDPHKITPPASEPSISSPQSVQRHQIPYLTDNPNITINTTTPSPLSPSRPARKLSRTDSRVRSRSWSHMNQILHLATTKHSHTSDGAQSNSEDGGERRSRKSREELQRNGSERRSSLSGGGGGGMWQAKSPLKHSFSDSSLLVLPMDILMEEVDEVRGLLKEAEMRLIELDRTSRTVPGFDQDPFKQIAPQAADMDTRLQYLRYSVRDLGSQLTQPLQPSVRKALELHRARLAKQLASIVDKYRGTQEAIRDRWTNMVRKSLVISGQADPEFLISTSTPVSPTVSRRSTTLQKQDSDVSTRIAGTPAPPRPTSSIFGQTFSFSPVPPSSPTTTPSQTLRHRQSSSAIGGAGGGGGSVFSQQQQQRPKSMTMDPLTLSIYHGQFSSSDIFATAMRTTPVTPVALSGSGVGGSTGAGTVGGMFLPHPGSSSGGVVRSRETLEAVERRNLEIKRIEASMKEMVMLFIEMNDLLEAQQPLFDAIEASTDSISVNVEEEDVSEGTEEIVEVTVEDKKDDDKVDRESEKGRGPSIMEKSRRKRCCSKLGVCKLAAFLVVLLVLLILVVVAYKFYIYPKFFQS